MSYLAESSRIYQSRSLGPIAETELVNVFKQQIELDREIERSKQKLTLQHDFNLQDAFAMFDPLNKSYIGAYDLERAMANFRVYAGKDEPDLLIRHFTKGLSRMGYAEFGKVFTSREPEYARMLNSRPREGRRVFSFETETKMQDLLRLHLRAESMAESLRQRLSSTHEFSLHRAFNDLDIDRNGYITLNEFESMLRHHGFPATTQDLQLLLERYDKNGDGRVSYGEFVQEVTPQSPRKH
jgi:Ca2+-binding EF-hand superfamily protein